MKPLSISGRLLLSYLLVAVLPLAGLAALYLTAFESSLRETVLANMATIADKKADQIDRYMTERLADAHLLSQRKLIRDGLVSLERVLRTDTMDAPSYQAIARQLRNELNISYEAGDFYDLLLMDTAGNVIFSLAREPDLGANLRNEPYRETQLAKGFNLTMQTLQTSLSRFSVYTPSGKRPSAFLTAPLLVMAM